MFRFTWNQVSWCRFISRAQALKRRDTDDAVAATSQSETSRIERRCCLRGYKQQRKLLRMSTHSTASALARLALSGAILGLAASGSPVLAAGAAPVHVTVPKVTTPPPVPKPAPVVAKVTPPAAAPAAAPAPTPKAP